MFHNMTDLDIITNPDNAGESLLIVAFADGLSYDRQAEHIIVMMLSLGWTFGEIELCDVDDDYLVIYFVKPLTVPRARFPGIVRLS